MNGWKAWALAAMLSLSTLLLGALAATTQGRLTRLETEQAEILKVVGVLPSINDRLGRIEQHLLRRAR